MIARPSFIDRLIRAYFRTGWRGFITLWRLTGHDFQSTLRSSTALGSVLELSPFGYIDGILLREGSYESEVTDAITSVLGSGVLWDVGANFGLHCLETKRRLPSCRVICFEPSIAMLSQLGRNRALNGLDIEVLALALSNRQGFRKFYLGPAGNPGMSTLSPWSGFIHSGTCTVPTARGDDLVAQGTVPSPNVIKIDVEGHEMPVLEGLRETLLTSSVHTIVYEDSRERDTPVKAFLKGAGFVSELLDRAESSRHELENFIAQRPNPHN